MKISLVILRIEQFGMPSMQSIISNAATVSMALSLSKMCSLWQKDLFFTGERIYPSENTLKSFSSLFVSYDAYCLANRITPPENHTVIAHAFFWTIWLKYLIGKDD